MKKLFIMAVLVGIIAMFMLSNQSQPIVNGATFSDDDKDYWLCWGQNATITNSYARLVVNDTSGSWTYSKVQQGVLPHGWTGKDTLAKEFKVDALSGFEGILFMRVVANRSEFQYYNETESWVNFGVGLWFKLNDDFNKEPLPDNEPQLVLDVRPISTKYGRGEVTFVTWDIYFKGSGNPDYDYHYLVTTNPCMKQNDTFYDITVDVGEYIRRAFEHYGIKEGVLTCVEPYVEASYGYGEVYVDFFEFRFQPKIVSRYTFMYGCVFGVVIFVVMFFILISAEKLLFGFGFG